MGTLIHTDCRFYRGDIPCLPNKAEGKECPTCEVYDPVGERLLILKFGAPGDVLRTTSLLPALKRKWPRCEITWLTRANARDLLRELSEIDRLLVLEEEGALQVLGESFDLCLNLDNDPLSSSLATQLRAVEKRGYLLDPLGRVVAANPEAQPWLEMASFDRIKRDNRRSYQDHMRAIAGVPDAPRDSVQIRFSEAERSRARKCLADLGIEPGTVVAFNTGSGDRWKTKRWPMESFLGLSLELAEQTSHRFLLLGGPVEDEANRLLVTERPDRFVYPGVLPLRVFMALVAECALLVTADTLALHVGIGTGIPTVALFGSTSAVEIEDEPQLLKIVSPVDCVCCYLKTCHKVPFCMDEITPAGVADEIKRAGWPAAFSGLVP